METAAVSEAPAESTPELRSEAAVSEAPAESSPELRSEELCVLFGSMVGCIQGDRCPYIHSSAEPKSARAARPQRKEREDSKRAIRHLLSLRDPHRYQEELQAEARSSRYAWSAVRSLMAEVYGDGLGQPVPLLMAEVDGNPQGQPVHFVMTEVYGDLRARPAPR